MDKGVSWACFLLYSSQDFLRRTLCRDIYQRSLFMQASPHYAVWHVGYKRTITLFQECVLFVTFRSDAKINRSPHKNTYEQAALTTTWEVPWVGRTDEPKFCLNSSVSEINRVSKVYWDWILWLKADKLPLERPSVTSGSHLVLAQNEYCDS